MNMTEWKTKDGRTLKITEMETVHIKNCMAYLEKKSEETKEPLHPKYDALAMELFFREEAEKNDPGLGKAFRNYHKLLLNYLESEKYNPCYMDLMPWDFSND